MLTDGRQPFRLLQMEKRDKSERDLKREEVIDLVEEVHTAHPSHGYRWVAAFLRINHGQEYSDNYVCKAFRYLGIQSEAKHQQHYRPRKVRDLFPNIIFTTWETADRPRQVIVSDTTVLKPWIFYLELTLYFGVFTKQILTWNLAERRGSRSQYIDGLADVAEMLHRYVTFYNQQRPCFAIGYDTPDNFYKRFCRGELEKKDTFSKRVLTEKPKFVQKRRTIKNNTGTVSTFVFDILVSFRPRFQ